ncbi:hypothetical protein [uncultured Jatrophihabitans sp.]|uniref:hypothetical protein n=1 Tax=uncultured Jatrophihabitans sp. TaxID=1610747 RepID=UPI0035CB8F25
MAADPRASVDSVGLGLLLAGTLAAAVSFVTLHWYSVDSATDSAGDGFTFADLHGNADQLGVPVATAYFDRLAWGLVAVVVLLGVAARVPSPLAPLVRVLGFLTGALGVAMTFYALAQLFDAQRAAGGSEHGVLHNAGPGLWLACAGYVLLALGAVVVPRRESGRSATIDR